MSLTMLRRKPVTSLEDLALGSFRSYLTLHCWRVAIAFRGVEKEDRFRRKRLLPLHIAELKKIIVESTSWYLEEKMTKVIISGVNDAVEKKQAMFTVNTPVAMYKTELFCMVSLVNLMLTPRLRRLEMQTIPRILRTQITAKLKELTGLEFCDMLLLGCVVVTQEYDSTELVAPSNVITALLCMKSLTHLVLPTFCTNNIIRALAETCRDTLTGLEIDHSTVMSDYAAADLLKLANLQLLSMANSPLTTGALARVIFGLPKLISLPNGDFLCDVLEWVVSERDGSILTQGSQFPQLAVRQFSCSEGYHFHSKRQMELVAKICPNIAQAQFFYDSEILCEIEVLETFHCLNDLRLNGGDYNKDPLRQLVEQIGHRLVRLEMNHVENIDHQALIQLSVCCTKLEFLSFSACSFISSSSLQRELFDYYNEGGLETIEEIELALMISDHEKNKTENLFVPFTHLTSLSISCSCAASTLLFILHHCPHLTKLFIGCGSELTDESLLTVLSLNEMPYLEEVEFRPMGRRDNMSRVSLDILVTQLQSLRRLKGLHYWRSLSVEEREDFSSWVVENNLDLEIEDVVPLDHSLFRGCKTLLSDENIRYYSTA